jgi:heme-binding protein
MPIPIRWSLGLLVALLIGAQFVRIDRTNPSSPPSASLTAKMPQDVRAIVERSCRDCHSNQTRWPWYSNVAPASWLLSSHVHNGRDTFNYSEWTSYSTDDQDKFLGAMCNLTKRGRMPMPSYLWLHREAVLSPADVSAICGWSEKMRDTLP